MCFGQVSQLLNAVHKPDAHRTARADRDLGLLGLVIGVVRGQRFFDSRLHAAGVIEFGDDLELRVEELDDAGQPVRLGNDRSENAQHGYGGRDHAVAHFQASDEEACGGGGSQHDGGAEVRLHDGHDQESDRDGRGRERVAAIVDCPRLPSQKVRQENH